MPKSYKRPTRKELADARQCLHDETWHSEDYILDAENTEDREEVQKTNYVLRVAHTFSIWSEKSMIPILNNIDCNRRKHLCLYASVASLNGPSRFLVQAGEWEVDYPLMSRVAMKITDIRSIQVDRSPRFRGSQPALCVYTDQYIYYLLQPEIFYEYHWANTLESWNEIYPTYDFQIPDLLPIRRRPRFWLGLDSYVTWVKSYCKLNPGAKKHRDWDRPREDDVKEDDQEAEEEAGAKKVRGKGKAREGTKENADEGAKEDADEEGDEDEDDHASNEGSSSPRPVGPSKTRASRKRKRPSGPIYSSSSSSPAPSSPSRKSKATAAGLRPGGTSTPQYSSGTDMVMKMIGERKGKGKERPESTSGAENAEPAVSVDAQIVDVPPATGGPRDERLDLPPIKALIEGTTPSNKRDLFVPLRPPPPDLTQPLPPPDSTPLLPPRPAKAAPKFNPFDSPVGPQVMGMPSANNSYTGKVALGILSELYRGASAGYPSQATSTDLGSSQQSDWTDYPGEPQYHVAAPGVSWPYTQEASPTTESFQLGDGSVIPPEGTFGIDPSLEADLPEADLPYDFASFPGFAFGTDYEPTDNRPGANKYVY